MNKKTIFVTSVQHTGTWFVLRFLENFIPNIHHTFKMIREPTVVKEDAIVHCHFPVANISGWGTGMELGGILTFLSIFKTVIPVRDPFAALLTRESRHPEERHFDIIKGFIKMVELRVMEYPNVKFLPIDLYKTVEERLALLNEIVDHCEIDVTEHQDLLLKIATEWKKEGYTPQNRFVEMYKEGDMEQIMFLLGPKQAEVEYLKNQHEIIFTQFLEKLGYKRKDLLW